MRLCSIAMRICLTYFVPGQTVAGAIYAEIARVQHPLLLRVDNEGYQPQIQCLVLQFSLQFVRRVCTDFMQALKPLLHDLSCRSITHVAQQKSKPHSAFYKAF